MPGKRATPETRIQQILSAADRVVLEVGIEAFTVDQVITKAGIAKGTVYNYYRNKDSMLADLATKALQLLLEGFRKAMTHESNHVLKIKALCLACYQFYNQHPRYFELISYMERPAFDIDISRYLELSHQLQQFTLETIRNGQERGEIRPDLDPNTVHYIVWACCVGVVEFVETKKRLLKSHHSISPRQMVETFAKILTEGIQS